MLREKMMSVKMNQKQDILQLEIDTEIKRAKELFPQLKAIKHLGKDKLLEFL